MHTHILRLKPGQDLRHSLVDFATENHLTAGFIITCVGSLQRVAIRMADQPGTMIYNRKFEIVSLSGTLSVEHTHLKLAVSDDTGAVIGGHLQDGCTIYTTAEIVLGVAEDVVFHRTLDEETGFPELIVDKVTPHE